MKQNKDLIILLRKKVKKVDIMPEELLKKFYLHINKEWKIAFISTLIIGLLTHFYVFTNMLPNHDGVNNFYDRQAKWPSGRFFLQYFAGISSYFELPLVNGLLGVLYLSLLSVVIIELFKLKKTLSIIIISGLIVTFPTIAATFSYMYTADAYFLSYFISALAILLSVKMKYGFLVGSILFNLSVGVYQTNLTFAMSLAILWFIKNLLYEDGRLKEQLLGLSRQVATIILGMIPYVLIFKILQWQNKITTYQGLNESGTLSFKELPNQFQLLFNNFINFFISEEMNLFEWLNICLFVLILSGLIGVLLQKARQIGYIKIVLVTFSLISLPIFSFFLFFVSPGVRYHMLMVISLIVFYMIPIIIYDNFRINNMKTKIYSWLSIILLIITIYNFSIISNITYLNMTLKYEKSYGLAIRILDRIEQIERTESKKIAVLGRPDKYLSSFFYKNLAKKVPIMTGAMGQGFISDSIRLRNTFDQYFGVEFQWASETEVMELENNMTVKNMDTWPSPDSIKIIDEYIVIKFQN